MKTAMVTGADGFIGRHLCRALSDAAWNTIALVRSKNRATPRLGELRNVAIIECDYANLQCSIPTPKNAPDAFVHLAWAGVSAECRDNFDLQRQNIDLSVAALRYAAAIGAGKFILPGSTFEYSQSGKIISGINDIPTPQNAYGAAKVASRYLCEFLARQCGLPFICTILSSSYGADRRDHNIIYYVIDSLLEGRSPDLTPLEQLWDYVHINDLARGLVAVCDRGVSGRCYPIGRGDNMPLKNYVETIHRLIAPDIPLGIGRLPYPCGNCPCSCVDMSVLMQDTGYRPMIDFEKGISEIIQQERLRRCH